MLTCTDPVDLCGVKIPHAGCSIDQYENGLGPGTQHIIQTTWITVPSEQSTILNRKPIKPIKLMVQNFS